MLYQSCFLTGFTQRIDFVPLEIELNAPLSVDFVGRVGEKLMLIKGLKNSDTISFVFYDPTAGETFTTQLVQPEWQMANQVNCYVNGDECVFILQTIHEQKIQIGTLGIDHTGKVISAYRVVDSFVTDEVNPSPFFVQSFHSERSILLSKWKPIPGTRKLSTLRLINAKGDVYKRLQIITDFFDEKENLSLFLHKGEVYAAIQVDAKNPSIAARTLVYKSGMGNSPEPIEVFQPDFYLKNLQFVLNPVSQTLYLGGLFTKAKSTRADGISLLQIDGGDTNYQYHTKYFDQITKSSLYPKRKIKKVILDDEISLRKLEYSSSGQLQVHIQREMYRREDQGRNREYFPDYRSANVGYQDNSLTPSQNFDRLRFENQFDPGFSNSMFSTPVPLSRATVTQVVNLNAAYSPPTASGVSFNNFDRSESGVYTNELITVVEQDDLMRQKELARSKLAMETLPINSIQTFFDNEFVSIQYPASRDYIIFQGRMSSGTNLSTKAFFSEKFYPFYGESGLVYAGRRKLATLYADKETRKLGLAILSW